MKVCYYPGCTLKADANRFEESARDALASFGVELEEPSRWTCCGTVFSLSDDNVMNHLAPVRNLLRARQAGHSRMMILCSMCFNTLARANKLFREDAAKREKIIGIMDREDQAYDGGTDVVHALQILKNDIGLEAIREKAAGRLKGIAVAAYYGCMLLRPDGIGIDEPESPRIFEDVMEAAGARVVSFPYFGECCGAYQTVENPDVVGERTRVILDSARASGADALVVSCPLCAFNLDQRQAVARKIYPNFESLPVLYFTELLAPAFGLEYRAEWLSTHYAPVTGVLEKAGIHPAGTVEVGA